MSYVFRSSGSVLIPPKSPKSPEFEFVLQDRRSTGGKRTNSATKLTLNVDDLSASSSATLSSTKPTLNVDELFDSSVELNNSLSPRSDSSRGRIISTGPLFPINNGPPILLINSPSSNPPVSSISTPLEYALQDVTNAKRRIDDLESRLVESEKREEALSSALRDVTGTIRGHDTRIKSEIVGRLLSLRAVSETIQGMLENVRRKLHKSLKKSSPVRRSPSPGFVPASFGSGSSPISPTSSSKPAFSSNNNSSIISLVDLQAVESKIASAQATFESLMGDHEALSQEVMAISQVVSVDSQVASLTEHAGELRSELKRTLTEYRRVIAQRDALQGQVARRGIEMEGALRSIDDSKTIEIARLEAALSQATLALESKEKECNQLIQATIKKAGAEIANARTQANKANQQVATLKKEFDESNSSHSSALMALNEEAARYATQVSDFQLVIERLNGRLQDSEAISKNSQADAVKLKDNVSRLQDELLKLEKMREAAEEEASVQGSKLAAVTAEHAIFSSRISTLENDLSEAYKRLAIASKQMSSDSENHQATLRKLENEKTELINKMETEKDELSQKLEDEKRDFARRLEEENKDLSGKLSASESTNANLLLRIDSLEREVAAASSILQQQSPVVVDASLLSDASLAQTTTSTPSESRRSSTAETQFRTSSGRIIPNPPSRPTSARLSSDSSSSSKPSPSASTSGSVPPSTPPRYLPPPPTTTTTTSSLQSQPFLPPPPPTPLQPPTQALPPPPPFLPPPPTQELPPPSLPPPPGAPPSTKKAGWRWASSSSS